jgi:hypothetical protein
MMRGIEVGGGGGGWKRNKLGINKHTKRLLLSSSLKIEVFSSSSILC